MIELEARLPKHRSSADIKYSLDTTADNTPNASTQR